MPDVFDREGMRYTLPAHEAAPDSESVISYEIVTELQMPERLYAMMDE